MKMFHVERLFKTLYSKGFLVFIMGMLLVSCITPRHTVEIQDYILLENGKEVLGKDKGLTAFIFENNPRKIAFSQFAANKYGVGSYTDVNYEVTIGGDKFRVFVYENAELEKYFDVSQFMVTKAETDSNINGSTARFIALSMINSQNEDCLTEHSLYKNIAITYLKNLKDEFNNL